MSADDVGERPPGARHRHPRQARLDGRRSLAHTAVAIVPGAGLLGTRYWRLGRLLLALTTVGGLALALLLVAKGATWTALSVAVRPELLLAIAVTTVLVALVWIFSIVLTHRGTVPKRANGRTRVGLQLFTAVMCLLVAVPSVQIVRYTLIQRDVVTSIFGTVPVAGSTAASGGSTAKPNDTAPDPWRNVGRVNLLLLGSDAGPDREGIRTDSMVVASIDAQTGDTVLVSIPRSLERAPFPVSNPLRRLYPNGYYCPQAKPGNECLINAVWAAAVENKTLFGADPSPGLTTIRDVIGEVTGLRIDSSSVINMAGFASFVDAMGGVTANVTERLPIGGRYIAGTTQITGVDGWIEPGRQKLDGYHALWYARSRLTSDDYSRMRRQRCLIGSILDQVNPVTMLGKYPELAKVAKDNFSTDIKVTELPAWVELVQRIQKASITSLTFTADNINPARPNFAKMRQMIQDAINRPPGGASPTTPAPATTASTAPSPTPTTPSNTPSGTPAAGDVVDLRRAC